MLIFGTENLSQKEYNESLQNWLGNDRVKPRDQSSREHIQIEAQHWGSLSRSLGLIGRSVFQIPKKLEQLKSWYQSHSGSRGFSIAQVVWKYEQNNEIFLTGHLDLLDLLIAKLYYCAFVLADCSRALIWFCVLVAWVYVPLVTERQLRCRRQLIDHHQLSLISQFRSLLVSSLIYWRMFLQHFHIRPREGMTKRSDMTNDRTASEICWEFSYLSLNNGREFKRIL